MEQALQWWNDQLSEQLTLEAIQIRDRLVLIDITALSVRDNVNAAGARSDNPGLVYGV